MGKTAQITQPNVRFYTECESHQHCASPKTNECTFLASGRIWLILVILRVCHDCRVRNKDNTLEVILFEYSRRLRGWSQIRGVKRCLVLCISTHKEDIGIEAPMRRISFFANIGRSHKRNRNWNEKIEIDWRRSMIKQDHNQERQLSFSP